MKMEFKIDGLAEFDNMLKELPASIAGKIGNRALREGAKVVLAEARRQAPVGDRVSLGGENQPGQLLRAIKIRTIRTKKKYMRQVVVEVSSRDAGINPHWVEYGTGPRIAKSPDGYLYFRINGRLIRKKQVKGVKAKPFIRRAVEIVGSQALAAIFGSLGPEIEREAIRLAKKGAKADRS